MCQQSIHNHHYLLNCQAGIFAQVTLGSARFSDCRNFGICRMSLRPETTNPGCKNCLNAYLRLDEPTGRLLLHFISSSVNQNVFRRFFSRQTFLMEDNFILPEAIANRLNFTDRTVIIERGGYPVLQDDRFLTVSLRLSDTNTSYLNSSGKVQGLNSPHTPTPA